MELKNLIASSETVDIYREGDKAVKIFKTGRKTDALYEALTHAASSIPTCWFPPFTKYRSSTGTGPSPWISSRETPWRI